MIKHKECMQKIIEKLLSEEISAQNMSLLAQIKLDDTIISHDDATKEISTEVEHRTNAISRLKSKSINKEDKKELEIIRKSLKSKIDESGAVFNKLEKDLATAKKELN